MWESIICAQANILPLFSLDIHEKSFLRFGPHSILTSYHRTFCRKLCYDFKDAAQKLNLACWFSLVVNLIWWHMKSNLGSVPTPYFFIFIFQLLTCALFLSYSLKCFVTWKSVKNRQEEETTNTLALFDFDYILF